MKKIILFCAICALVGNAFAQKETFDVTTYTVPKDWKKQPAEGAVQFSKEDAAKGTYCIITLFKAVPGKTDSKENFDLAWASVVKEMATVFAAPEMQPSATEDGWETQSGYAPFESDGNKGVVVLVTASGFGKMVNMIILTNTDVYEKDMTDFLESVSLKKMETNLPPSITDDKNSILGTWGATASDNSNYRMKNGIMNYISRQYTFNADGSYSFVSKVFDPLMDKILLGKETGTYQINGTNLSINPKKTVLEAWSKKNGADDWGKLINTQNIPLEKATYQFTKHYFSGTQIWNLVLQAGKATQRDGPFSNNTTFSNAWYYAPISANNTAIELPGGQKLLTEEIKKVPVQQTVTNDNTYILGTWGISVVVPYRRGTEGSAGSNVRQYTFNTNGTYTFYIKTFRYKVVALLLTRESGTYQINGNNITINPHKSVIEAWSKKDGTDKWGKLLSSQNKTLEKTTYQFTKHYFSGIQQRELVLQANKETQRDGAYNSGTAFSNAWIYSPVTCKDCFIKLPD